MFTGIVEEVAEVVERHDSGTNRDLIIRASMTPQLKVDQSVSHNGVCLTVVSVSTGLDVTTGTYRVTAVKETLERSNLGHLRVGDAVNIEIERSTQVFVDTLRDAIAERLGPLQPLLEGLLRDKGLSLDEFARPTALPPR